MEGRKVRINSDQQPIPFSPTPSNGAGAMHGGTPRLSYVSSVRGMYRQKKKLFYQTKEAPYMEMSSISTNVIVNGSDPNCRDTKNVLVSISKGKKETDISNKIST